MTIDSHQHFWIVNDTDYPWMEGLDAIRRDFQPSDLFPLLHVGGLDGCVAVQARQMVVETEWLLGLAEENEWIRGVVGWVPLCENAGEPILEKVAAHPKLVGVRHVVHDEPDDDFILRDDFNEGVRRSAEHGLVYDVLIFWKHLPQTIRFADRHPDQALVIDHIAKPRICGDAFDEEWAKGIRELAKRENVSCKLSGMVTEVRDERWNVEVLRPYFDAVLGAFGPDRLLFGSDWPVCTLRAEHTAWVKAARELTASLSTPEKAAFWGGNAVRVYGLE